MVKKDVKQIRAEEAARILSGAKFHGHLKWSKKQMKVMARAYHKWPLNKKIAYWKDTKDAAIERASLCSAFAYIAAEMIEKLMKGRHASGR